MLEAANQITDGVGAVLEGEHLERGAPAQGLRRRCQPAIGSGLVALEELEGGLVDVVVGQAA